MYTVHLRSYVKERVESCAVTALFKFSIINKSELLHGESLGIIIQLGYTLPKHTDPSCLRFKFTQYEDDDVVGSCA